MQDLISTVGSQLELIRLQRPLVHNITNYVVMNFTANALLALGASPVMAHAPEEVEEMAGLAGALVLNLGTLSTPWIESMFQAGAVAQARSIPIVLDPVGAGATRFRTETALRLLTTLRVTVLRANASEVLALAGQHAKTRGVDSGDTVEKAGAAANALAQQHRCIVAMTGVQDFVTDGTRSVQIANGHALMGRVTGTGCVASALTGAFCAVENDAWLAAIGALVTFGVAGELAARSAPGPGTFHARLLDALAEVDRATLRQRARITQLPSHL